MYLLLLPLEAEDCSKIPESTNTYTLHDLFDINLGLIEDRFIKLTKNSNESVMFLRLSSFVDDDARSNKIYLQVYTKINIIDFKNLEKKNQEYELKATDNSKKNFIPDQKVVQEIDYLISLRGRPKGYSMLKSIEHQSPKVVCSNHFIQIRPRQTQIESMHIPYLHLLLDMIVERKIKEEFEKMKMKEDTQGKKYSAYNSLRVQDLREMKICIPIKKEDQEIAYNLYEKNYNDFLNANLQFDSFKQCLSQKIIK